MPVVSSNAAAAARGVAASKGYTSRTTVEDTEGPDLDMKTTLRASIRASQSESGEASAKPTGEHSSVTDNEFLEVLEKEGLHELDEDSKKVNVPIVERPQFDMGIGFIISVNALIMGFECDLKVEGEANVGWVFLDNFFCLVWIAEMILKLYYLGTAGYFKQAWNLLDFFLVLLSINDAWIMPFIGADGMEGLSVIRMVRMLRILRLLRLLRLMKMFKNLWLIVSGFYESLSTLYWVLLLMSLVVYIFSVFLRSTIDCDDQFNSWQDCSVMFGTVPRSMYTLFQVITLESWSMAIGRPIFEISPIFIPVFVIFLFLTTFGMLNIIVGVIVENTLNVAKQNQELQDKRHQKAMKKDLENLRVVFEEADADGSGTMELDEFEEILLVPSVKAMLLRMEIPVDEPGVLFQLLDEEGNGSINFVNFTEGVQKVKGPPTGLDMKSMQVAVTGIARRLQRLEDSVKSPDGMESRLQKMEVNISKLVAHQLNTTRLLFDKLGIETVHSTEVLSADEDEERSLRLQGQGPQPPDTSFLPGTTMY